MTDEKVVDWKQEWSNAPESEKTLRIMDVLNMTVVITGVKYSEGTSRDGKPLTFVILETDKGKVKTTSQAILRAAKSFIEPNIKAGVSVRATVRSKMGAHGVFYYFEPPRD